MDDELENGLEGSGRGLIDVISWNFPEGNVETFKQDGRSPGRYLKLRPPKYAGMLTAVDCDGRYERVSNLASQQDYNRKCI
jgi:hypothetical protein